MVKKQYKADMKEILETDRNSWVQEKGCSDYSGVRCPCNSGCNQYRKDSSTP